MNIGILTYHNAINYGAVLQAYALQEVIKRKLSPNVQFINYKCPGVEKQYNFVNANEASSIKGFILGNLTAVLRKKKKENFRKFISQKLYCTNKVKNFAEKVISQLDTIIVGSDQVWNPSCTEGDAAFLLGQISDKINKISYAASMGGSGTINDYKERYGVDYIEVLKEFSSISCREEDGAKFLSNKLNRSCTTVVDPVLLCDISIWKELIEDNESQYDIPEEKYIFVYNLGNLAALRDVAFELRKRTGYTVIVINKDAKGDVLYWNCKNCSNVGPEEFLSLLVHAEIVLADSFHATAFSILFHKKFFIVGNPNKVNTNSRIENILKHYGLEKQYITSSQENIDISSNIDFSVSDNGIFSDKERSFKWLKEALVKNKT